MFHVRLPRGIPLPIIWFSDTYIQLAWNQPGIYLDVDSDCNEVPTRLLPLSFFRYLRRFTTDP